MPTTIITGRDVSFTIASTQYSSQATSATLTVETTINTYQTLAGKAYFTTDTQGSFAVEMLADWGAASSLCEALWTAAIDAPQTPLLVSLTADTGACLLSTFNQSNLAQVEQLRTLKPSRYPLLALLHPH
jgi:hypothetical protein